MKRSLALLLTLVMSLGLLAGCGSKDSDNKDGKKVFTVGIDAEYPPFSYLGDDGNYTGFTLCNGQKGSVCMNLAQMQKLIAENLSDSAATFARIGKRHIINMNYVFHISLLKQRLTLSDGASFAYDLDISKEALKKLKDIYTTSVRTLANSKK